MVAEYTKEAIKRYHERLKNKGFVHKSIWILPEEFEAYKAFIAFIRKVGVENIKTLEISEEDLTFKIIINDKT